MDSVTQAIDLARKLNDPAYAHSAPEISSQLQNIQLSQDGWAVGDAMLSIEDNSIQFYGALTFQIKLNRDAQCLNAEDAEGVLQRLMICFLSCVRQSSSRLVFDKVCSALATYFIQSPVEWLNAIHHVMVCLYQDAFVQYTSLAQSQPASECLQHFSSAQEQAVLRFCLLLAEDLGGLEGASPKHTSLEQSMKTNMPTVISLLEQVLRPDLAEKSSNSLDAISVYSAWTSYALTHWNSDNQSQSALQSVSNVVLNCLSSPSIEISESAADTIAELLDQKHRMFSDEQKGVIWAALKAAFVCDFDLTEQLSSMKLAATLAQTWIPNILSDPHNQTVRQMLNFQSLMISRPDWKQDGCETILLATDFWNEYAEAVVNDLFETPKKQVDTTTMIDLLNTLHPYLSILQWPSESISDIDDDFVEEWRRLRDDIFEFAQKIAGIPKSGLLDVLFPYTSQSLANGEWAKAEAGLTLYNSVADEIVVDDTNRDAIEGIFANLARFEGQDTPLRLKRAAIRFVDSYMTFLKQKPQYMMSALHLLLSTIEASLGRDTKVADFAAKGFASLCSACRHVLVSSTPECVQTVEAFFAGSVSNTAVTTYQKEKIYAAISAIVEAMPDEAAKIAPLSMLVSKLHDDLRHASSLLSSGDSEQGEALGVGALQCLAAVGKAMQYVVDDVVDLEEDTEATAQHETPSLSNTEELKRQVWGSSAGTAVQQQIISCLETISAFNHLPSAWEAVCSVLRVGLAEQIPGPFVFAPTMISSFLSNMSLSIPLIEALLTTACTFVSAYSRAKTALIPSEIYSVYVAVARIMSALSEPQNDPQVSQLCIDLLERLIPRYPDVLLGLPQNDLSGVFSFALKCLTSDAPMLKRTTCSFFSAFLELPKTTSNTDAKISAEKLTNELGPHLASCLMNQLGGLAQRSELESLSKVLKAFITMQTRAKMMLEQALMGVAFPSDKVGPTEKQRFVQKIVMLRGGRLTGAVVKDFWAACRGTVSSF